jgi:hypothetical protein
MKAFKRFVSWCVSQVRRVIEPDFTATHYPSLTYVHTRYPDFYDDTLPGQRRGEYSDDFLAGHPRRHDPNETCAGFPRRAAITFGHGWRIPVRRASPCMIELSPVRATPPLRGAPR